MLGLDLLPSPLRAWHERGPASFWIVYISSVLFILVALIYVTVYLAAPLPRAVYASEVIFRSIGKDGKEGKPRKLPCWQDKYLEQAEEREKNKESDGELQVELPEVLISVVVPAYNEEDRLREMLQEAVEFLDRRYPPDPKVQPSGVRQRKHRSGDSSTQNQLSLQTGWELLIVSDGSTDKTESVALDFAESNGCSAIRVIRLEKNRGKGGAVVHGMRHVRGEYILFADADGASKFEDLEKLVEQCQRNQDSRGCAVAVGSRAHLVGSEAVVNRSWLRNLLMRSFHLLLRLLTTEATSKIRDTQCGFKLFSRQTLPHIVPHMHSEGWIFDIEMLMLAEKANMPVVEVPVGWHEVKGSKLNVFVDSIAMAWGLVVVRAAWALGVYQIDRQESVAMDELKPNAKSIWSIWR